MQNGSKTCERSFNFSAGPCCLPVEVLQEAQQNLLNWNGCGMGVMEMSHRGKDFMMIYRQTVSDLREILDLPADYHLVFMQGGATQQFAAIPLNILDSVGIKESQSDYAITGSWSQKAYEEGLKYSKANIVCDSKNTSYTSIPTVAEWKINKESKYLHYCANETIYGVEFKETPAVDLPLVADMSSNFCSKPVDVRQHDLIYAGIQKNLGPAGAAVVIIKDGLITPRTALSICPSIMNYKLTIKGESMYNTPPCWAIYMTGLMARYIKSSGGLSSWKTRSEKKSQIVYDVIDSSQGYFSCPVAKEFRSNMNIPFRVGYGDEALEKKFLEACSSEHLVGLAGHRSVGGCRASLYNGMPIEGVEKLADIMKSFMAENFCEMS